MLKTSKKIIVAIIVLTLVVTYMGATILAMTQDDKIEANKELLESTINNRPWVIDTLVKGKIDNNPYSGNSAISDKAFLKNEIITNYEKKPSLKCLVTLIEIQDNPTEYLATLTEEELQLLMSTFNSSSMSDLAEQVDKWIKSMDELRYESVLNDVLLNNYTASTGETLFEEDMKLEVLRQRAEIYNKIDAYSTALTTHLNLTNKESSVIIFDPDNFVESEYEITTEDYVANMLGAYKKNLGTYLDKNINLPGLEGKSALEGKILSTSALAMTLACEYSIGNDENPTLMKELFRDYMCDDILLAFKTWDTMFNIEEYSVNQAIVLEALINQKNTTTDSINRLAEYATDNDMKQVILQYAELCEKEGKNATLSYNDVVSYIRDKNTITNLMSKVGKKGLTSFLNEPLNYKGCSKYIGSGKIASLIAKSGEIVNLGVWLGDQLTGIKATSKGIYLCKSVDKLIDKSAIMFSHDLEVYYNDKTEENATKVINDLELLKKLRLYGEKTAYDITKNQMDSWIGALLSDDSDLEFQKKKYQQSVDLLMGCSLSPVGENKITISEGEKMGIQCDDTLGTAMAIFGDKLLYEMDYKLMGGLEINGGTFEIIETPDSGLYIPNIKCTGNTTLNIGADNIAIGQINNTGTLNIQFENGANELTIAENIINTGTINIKGQKNIEDRVNAYMMDNSSTINISNTKIELKGNIINNGTVLGQVIICGDGIQQYDNGYFKYGRQTISGTGLFSNITFNNLTKEGVKIAGTQTVTEYISNSDSKLRTGYNLQVTGECQINGNYFASSLGFKDYKTSKPLIINGTGYIYNDVTFEADTTFNGDLNLTSSCKALTTTGSVDVKGDMKYSSGQILGDNWLNLYGDISITASSPAISKIKFTGKVPQSLSSYNVLTVASLDISNTSTEGVNISTRINVTDKLYSTDSSDYRNCKNVFLTGTARVQGNLIKGSISAESWTCADSVQITEYLYASGNIVILDNNKLSVGAYRQSEGTLTVDDGALLECTDDFSNSTTTNQGMISVKGDCKITGDLTGGKLMCKGDVKASSTIQINEFVLNGNTGQVFCNSGSTTTEMFEINNQSKAGVDIQSKITVTKEFNNNCNNLINSKNIVLTGKAKYLAAQDIKGDISTSGELTIQEGEEITVNGRIYAGSGASITVEKGATLNVKNCIISSSGVITVQEGGKLQIDDYLSSTKDTLNIEGEMVIKGDAKISSSIINGPGILTFKGDLITSSGTWNKPDIAFISKLPQVISGSAVTADDLTLNNESKSGVTLKSTVNYYGEINKNASSIDGESYIVKKQ